MLLQKPCTRGHTIFPSFAVGGITSFIHSTNQIISFCGSIEHILDTSAPAEDLVAYGARASSDVRQRLETSHHEVPTESFPQAPVVQAGVAQHRRCLSRVVTAHA